MTVGGTVGATQGTKRRIRIRVASHTLVVGHNAPWVASGTTRRSNSVDDRRHFAVRTIFALFTSTQTERSCLAVHARIGLSVRLSAWTAVGADGVAGGRADQAVGEVTGGARCCRSPTDLSYCTSSTGPRLSSAVRSGCAVRAAARSGERERTSSAVRARRCSTLAERTRCTIHLGGLVCIWLLPCSGNSAIAHPRGAEPSGCTVFARRSCNERPSEAAKRIE